MTEYDVAIIGAGPGGYVAAIRAAQLGLRTALFERDRIGGVCLNWGCIPSKALLKNADVVNLVHDAAKWGITTGPAQADLGAAIDRSRKVVDQLVGGVEGLLKEAGVDVIAATAQVTARGQVTANGTAYTCRNIIIATGASERPLPGVPIDGTVVISARNALELRTPPPRVVIIGAGPIGVEFAHIWASYGSNVTLVEMQDTLVPLEDPDIGRALKRSYEARGMRCLVKTRVDDVTVSGASATVTVSAESGSEKLEADVVLVAIGYIANTASLGIDRLGVETQRGFIQIDEAMQTNVPGIYAIGDITGKLMLAHVASQQGVIAAEHIAGRPVTPLDYIQIPRATFCQPQIGSIGYTEKQAREAGFTVKTGRFPFTALGKAVASGETEGFVKVIADEKTGQVLGIHMLGHDISALLGEATMVSLLEATTVEVGFAVHTHPTLAEAIKEAALAADGEAIHIAQKRRPRPAEGVATA